MANQQRGQLQVVSDIGRESHIDAAGFQAVDNGLAQAAGEIGGVFGQMSAKVGALADHAAAKEGAEAGKLAGIDPEFRPSHSMTIRGEAADAAGLSVYKAKAQQEIHADFQMALVQHGHDPKALANIFEAKSRGWQSKIIPEAWPELSIAMSGERLAGMREASRNQLAAQHADQVAAAQLQVQESLANVSRLGRTLGLDAEADAQLAASRAAFAKALQRSDATGRRLVGPSQALELLKHFDQQVLDSRLFGAYDRLPDLEAKKSFIDKFKADYEAGTGLGQKLNNDQFVRSYHQLEAQFSKDRVAANVGAELVTARVRQAVSTMEKGYPVQADEMAAIQGQIVQLGAVAKDQKLREQLAEAQTTLRIHDSLKVLPPDELAQRIAAEKAEAQAAGTLPRDVHRIELADKLLGNMRTELKTNPLGWADRVGLVKVPPLDFSKPDVPQQLADRVVRAEQIARHYKLHLPGQEAGDAPADAARIAYLTPDERTQIGAVMAQGGAQAVQVAAIIAQNERAPQILADLGKHAPTMALLGKLVVDAPGNRPPPVAIDAANGFGLLRLPDYKPKRGPQKDIRDATDSVIGPALSALPATETAVVEMANAAYEARAHRMGKKDFDAELWKKTLSEAVGESEVAGQKYGGIVYQGTGWMLGGTHAIVLPPNVRQSAFDTLRRSIKLTDLDAVPQIEATSAVTRAGGGVKSMVNVPPADFQRATLKTAGDGKYFMALGDPDGADAKWLLDKSGAKYVLDLKKLEPTLRGRMSSAFLGGN